MVIGRKSLILITAIFMYLIPEKANAIKMNNSLNQQLNLVLKQEPNLNGAIIGVSVRSSSSGQILYQHFGDTRLRPASNLKLLTAAAALAVLGKDHFSRTEVLTKGKIKGKTLKGNMYIKGKGDPTLVKSDLDKLAANIYKHQIRKIDGDLIGDDTWYDNVRYSIDMPWSDETAYYGAQVSALTVSPNKDYDQGTVIIEAVPGKKIGDKAAIRIIPKTNYVKVINKIITISADEKKKIKITREHAKNTIIIEGKLPVNAKKTKEQAAVWEPTNYTLTLFKQSLNRQGIKVEGKLKIRKTPVSSKLLTFHDSSPLWERLIPFMKLSNNGHGEMLIKEIGKVKKGEGSWEKGLIVLKKELIKLGINPDNMVLRDGSGISHVNLINANQITQLLYAVQNEEWFPQFQNSLPIAGEKDKMIGGSLKNRLKNLKGKVKAKTGTLSTVSSLSGYAKAKNGETFIFSILINNLLNEETGKKIEDKLVKIIANQ